MLENVKNLCSHDKGRTFKIIQESLAELDYEVFFDILDGKGYVPQHRERIVIVGFDSLKPTKTTITTLYKCTTPKTPQPP